MSKNRMTDRFNTTMPIAIVILVGLWSTTLECRADEKEKKSDKQETAKKVEKPDADKPPVYVEGKRLWAKSFRWTKAPKFVVEKWLTDKPDMKGKYVLIQFWATWCGPCRRSIPVLNGFHKKFGDELVMIGVSEESKEDVLKMEKPKIDYFVAVDTKMRMKDKLGVWGIPHVIIIEPGGYVIWEGFPLQENYELTEEIIEKILEVGRKLKAAKEKEKQASAAK